MRAAGEGGLVPTKSRHNRGEGETPLPSPPRGRRYVLLKPIIDLENQHAYQPRKEVNKMPSPLGEGQTDMPINRHNRGEGETTPALHLHSRFC